ncbi:RNA-binding protein [Bacteriovoracaceae bacterium]|nr:RNA-binding protein [Bacteriovoracaceae bacterium]
MNNKLYVGNLSFDMAEGDLEQLFADKGQVVSVKLIKDRDTGRSKGFAFIEMGNGDDALKAQEELNGTFHLDRAMVVNEAKEKTDDRSRRDNRRW